MNPSFRILYCSLLLAGASSIVSSQDEPPRLVIDPRGHSALVKELIFTPDGEELISLGFDKTIRVWDVKTGALRDTLRTQTGPADAGKHFAGALSPDGRYLAVAGWATENTEHVGRIRVIDRTKKKMAAVLRGHTNVVHDLAFSRDGSLLASGSADHTVRLWKTERFTGGQEGEALDVTESEVLRGHERDVHAVSLAHGGRRLVSASFDGTILIRDRSEPGSPFTETHTLTGHPAEVSALAVTSDGARVVSGDMQGNLFFWNATTGSRRKDLDRNLERQIGTLAMSPDETRVLASSTTANDGKTAIFSLDSGEEPVTFSEHDNSVYASAWSPEGDLVATSGGNLYETYLWRPVEIGGEKPGTVVHRIVGDGWPIYNVGFSRSEPLEVVLGVQAPQSGWLPQAPLNFVFDFAALDLQPLRSAEQDTLLLQAGGSEIVFESDHIRVPGRGTIANPRNPNDPFRTATFPPGGDGVVAGSAFYLLRFSDSGGSFREIADYVGHEADINAVSISREAQRLVSGSMDQTARLWNYETGDLLASLFLASDGEWVCWTPSGYFAASADAGKYIGWHFNRGLDRMADFISGEQLYDHYYRPDIVKTAITENRPSAVIVEQRGIAFDLERAMGDTPGIEIVEPTDDHSAAQRRLAVLVEAIDQGGGIGEVRVFHEGKRLQPDGPGSFRDGRYRVPFTVSLLSGENRIRALAVNPDGVESAPETVTVRFSGVRASAKLYLLAVGLNEYKNPRFALNYCRPDVDAFAEVLRERAGRLFADMEVHKLYDGDATGEGIAAKLREIAGKAEADDVFVFVFAGHGVMSEGDGERDAEFHIIPWDVTQMYGDDDLLARKALSGSRLQEMAAAIPARKQLMVLDACQSGGVVDSFAVRGAAEERALAQLARSTGMYVLASTRTEQFATEAKELGHGLFTFALLEGLEGRGDVNEDGKITVKEVEAWLNERVPELSEEHTGAAQYPNSFARGQDFPIGVTE